MPESIKASEQNLDKVFCDEHLFEIPFYQRPYAWTTDEVGELLEDLLFAMKRGDDCPYFLGSIVRIWTRCFATSTCARVRQRPDPLARDPFYQRPYAWTTDEVGELLEDLLFAMKRGDDCPYWTARPGTWTAPPATETAGSDAAKTSRNNSMRPAAPANGRLLGQ